MAGPVRAGDPAQAKVFEPVPGERTEVTVKLDVALPATGTISGTVSVPDEGSLTWVNITVVDATTGDWAGVHTMVRSDGAFTVKGLNTQEVRLTYSLGNEWEYPDLIHTTAGEAVTGITTTVPAT
ncbi:MAG: hypothetical protein ACRDTU_06950 [Micromonosporaceae bacterium]